MLLTFCLYKRKKKREYEIHKDAIGGNEKTNRNTDEGNRRKGKGRMQWRDKQSIICGVERVQREGVLPRFLLEKVILLFNDAEKKIQIQIAENKILRIISFLM